MTVASVRAVSPRRLESLSLSQARRIALTAQGFADPPLRSAPGLRALRRVISRVGLIQLDSVNVLVRSHYLPMFSRVGPYPAELLDRAAHHSPRILFEYWGHEASLLPVTTQPLLRWRMSRAATDAWGSIRRIQAENPGLVNRVLAAVAARGPATAGEIAGEIAEVRRTRSGPWWDWDETKKALEWLFFTGEITSHSRRGFERLYDLTERVLPAEVLAVPTPEPADARRELIRLASCALGVATEKDLRDYFRLTPADARPGLTSLVEAGEVIPVTVEGWRQRGYLHPAARLPRQVNVAALLSPFDSLIWERSRVERLWGFRYRLEIYTPKPKRLHGYYVLPFLFGDQLVARVDLKADRQAGALRVLGVHYEPGCNGVEIAEGLAGALTRLGQWLGLTEVRHLTSERGASPPIG